MVGILGGQMSKGKSRIRRPRAKHRLCAKQTSRKKVLLSLVAVLAIIAVPGFLQIARSQQPGGWSACRARHHSKYGRFRARPPRSILRRLPQPETANRQPAARSSWTSPASRDHAEIGEKVVRKLRAGMMPPSGMPRPAAPVLECA